MRERVTGFELLFAGVSMIAVLAAAFVFPVGDPMRGEIQHFAIWVLVASQMVRPK